jgi:hypothetical protein
MDHWPRQRWTHLVGVSDAVGVRAAEEGDRARRGVGPDAHGRRELRRAPDLQRKDRQGRPAKGGREGRWTRAVSKQTHTSIRETAPVLPLPLLRVLKHISRSRPIWPFFAFPDPLPRVSSFVSPVKQEPLPRGSRRWQVVSCLCSEYLPRGKRRGSPPRPRPRRARRRGRGLRGGPATTPRPPGR